MARSPRAKTLTIGTAGTATQADANYRWCERVHVRNPTTNTGLIYFGGSNLNSTNRASVAVGSEFIFYGIDLTELYVTVAVNNEKVEIVFYI